MEKIFSAKLKQARGDLNQNAFADFLGIPQQSYSRYERGSIPDGATLLKIAYGLKITVEELLTGKPPGPGTLQEAMIQEGVYFEPEGGGLTVTLNKKVTLGDVLQEMGKLIDSGMTPREMLTRLKLTVSYSKRKPSSKAKSDAAKLALEVSDELNQKKPPA